MHSEILWRQDFNTVMITQLGMVGSGKPIYGWFGLISLYVFNNYFTLRTGCKFLFLLARVFGSSWSMTSALETSSTGFQKFNRFSDVRTDTLEHRTPFTWKFIWVQFMEYFLVRVRFHRTTRRKHASNPIHFCALRQAVDHFQMRFATFSCWSCSALTEVITETWFLLQQNASYV